MMREFHLSHLLTNLPGMENEDLNLLTEEISEASWFSKRRCDKQRSIIFRFRGSKESQLDI